MSTARQLVIDAADARPARDAFLASGDSRRNTVNPWVRISWERSQDAQVDVERPRAVFSDNWQSDTTLTRASRPVLDALADEIANEPVCLILTDAKGTVLDRRGGDAALLQNLDRVDLAPGFVYSEEQVGTNGIGTALEVGGPVLVNGSEHYAGALTRFSCAGALITHPVNGSLLGVIDLTTSARNTNPLLLSFAKMAARRIRDRILENAGALERALLDDYYATCHHSGKPVLAVGGDVLMLNAQIHQRFDAQDQSAIIAQTHEVRGSTAARSILAELPSGLSARLSYTPSFAGDELAGGIVVVREHVNRSPRGGRAHVPLRGVVGDSPAWRRATSCALTACSNGKWTVFRGEKSTGRARLIQATHDQARAGRHLFVIDGCAEDLPLDLVEIVEAELKDGSDVALLDATGLPVEVTDGITDLLQNTLASSYDDRPWIAMTVGDDEEGDSLPLTRLFDESIAVPPLRQRIDDLPALTRHLLDGMRATELSLSSAAAAQLARLSWPGNIAELRAVLHGIARQRRSGIIEVDDLPAGCRSTSRRTLTPMEAIERDAIVEALTLHHGDKGAAAEALGISRATIYRRIRDFGIVV